MVRPGRPAFDLSGRSFVTVWDFMGQELGLKGVDLVVYARIFGFHQADRDYYESKHSAAAFFEGAHRGDGSVRRGSEDRQQVLPAGVRAAR